MPNFCRDDGYCETCEFWNCEAEDFRIEEALGKTLEEGYWACAQCHRRGPSFHPALSVSFLRDARRASGTSMWMLGYWPLTQQDHFCGEYQKISEAHYKQRADMIDEKVKQKIAMAKLPVDASP